MEEKKRKIKDISISLYKFGVLLFLNIYNLELR